MGKLISVVTLFIILYTIKSVSTKKTLYVGALLELSNHWYQRYVNFFINIIEYVFEQVENRTDILADYSLKLITKDTQGNNGLAAKRFFELMTEGPPIVAVLGPTLSYELTVVGQITPFYHVLQLSYIALTSTTLTKAFFPTLFMVNQIMDDLSPLRIKMMQYFKWNRVGTFFYQNDIYVSHMNIFHDLLKEYNMTLITSAVGSLRDSDIKVLISRLKQYDVRIIMGTFSGTDAPFVFCEAYKQGLFGNKYVWILAGPVIDLVPDDFSDMGCTYEEFLEASDGHFSLNFDKIDSQNPVTIANMTPVAVTGILKEKLAETEFILSSYYGWVYDTAWALAVGLNNSLQFLNESGLDHYSNSPYYLDAILRGMHDVSFAGISGPVSFDESGRRAGVTYIEHHSESIKAIIVAKDITPFHFRNAMLKIIEKKTGTKTRVAMYNQKTDNLTWFVPPDTLWPDGVIPRDRFTYYSVRIPPNIPSLVLMIIGNTACFVIAVGFLVFNIYYRRNSNIKLSSPMINNIIIAGSILMFICVFITTFDYGHMLPTGFQDHVCMIRVWIMCLGFTCLFGALFSKTWRVHILFRDHQLKKTTIKDFHLFGIIVFLLLFDCIVLIPWSLTHSLQKETVARKTKDLYDYNNIIAEEYSYCYHPYEGYWFVSVYIYKGLLLAFGTFLAWETRHVTVPALNDSKYIGFCIYNVVIVCVFGVPLTHVLPTEQTTLNFVLLSSLVMFCTTMCLCILFIPKIKIRNKVGGKFLNPSLNTNTLSGSGSGQKPSKSLEQGTSTDVSKFSKDKDSGKPDVQNVEELKNEINRQKMLIEAETIAMERLKRLLLEATGDERYAAYTNVITSDQMCHKGLTENLREDLQHARLGDECTA